ncbi:MFS transporter [Aquibaculum sediminis]|uniref:MFS transporter n=1 Tax=Aquibaculum sediminis TaxID=3231907 RepID=UPI003452CB85
MSASRLRFLFLNVGHAYDHFFMLIYPTVAVALELSGEGFYGDLLMPATAGFIAFAAFTLPAGWLGDVWSRRNMMALMFLGLGASSVFTATASSTWHLAAGLFCMGAFAAIYHPVGIAMVAESQERVGRLLGINGVWGNMGVAAAPILTGALTVWLGWQAAFVVPGALAIITGLAFLLLVPDEVAVVKRRRPAATAGAAPRRDLLIRVFSYLAISSLLGGVIFAVLTIVMPKIVEANFAAPDLGGLIGAAGLASLIFAGASMTQLVTGPAADRYSPRVLMLLLGGVQVPLLLLLLVSDAWAAMAVALVLMIATFGIIPIQDAIVARYAAAHWRARVYSVKYVLSLGVSATAVPLAAWGYSPDAGFNRLYVVLTFCALGVVAAALLLPRPQRLGEEAVQAAE